MKILNSTPLPFNERAFLIRALLGVFLIQFATVGYQTYSCQVAMKSVREVEKVSMLCQNASSTFNETGKLALTTFLALLVPSQSAASVNSSLRARAKKESPEAEG